MSGQRYFALVDGKAVETDLMGLFIFWSEHGDERQLALDTIGPATISTAFIGIDSNPGHPRPFETLIRGGPHDDLCMRYATRGATCATTSGPTPRSAS